MKQEILITAKTYPTPSKKYGELVCTAGLTKKGEWIRLYPIPFRILSKTHKYKKYQWIEVDLEKDLSDPRNESYKIVSDIILLNKIGTENNWNIRKNFILHNIYTNKENLIFDCRKSFKQISLAIFKPKEIIAFHIENIKHTSYNDTTYKLPFKFYYKFYDDNNKISRLQIIDWEIGELARKLIRKYNSDIKTIKSVLKEKYFDNMLKRDVYLFLGTNKEWHIRKSPNPFMIIGVFYPPIVNFNSV